MLNPRLTYEGGIEAIGNVTGSAEWLLDANSWAKIKTQRLQARDFLSKTFDRNMGIDIDEALHGPLEELIYNAGEHGTEFGKKGIVKVQVTVGEKGSLWTVEQPTNGPDFETVFNKQDQDLHYSGSEDGAERERGIGFTETVNDEALQVWSAANRVICLRLNK
ncbi:hypothetical protein M0P48_01315 [Candidatus Gracilibacteria bacterium]|jgi:anti-sigma regulatory factor (Ser/Thr protein kinase)|nr:hypothetical protein [Candidatus Gracilibacteria bacterium]